MYGYRLCLLGRRLPFKKLTLMKGECMSKFDNELPMCEGNYVVERDYEWCPICLGTGVKQEKNYNQHCAHCNGSQGSAWDLLGYTPGSKDVWLSPVPTRQAMAC